MDASETLKLLIIKNGNLEKKLSVQQSQEVFIGKAGTENQVVLDDPVVSRKHACLSFNNNQGFIKDLGSTNHTFLNGTLLTPHQPFPVKSGDIVKFGSKGLFEIKIEGGAGSKIAPPVSGKSKESGYLEFFQNGRKWKDVPLAISNKISVGKSGFNNAVELDDPSVSRNHAILVFDGSSIFLTDLGSTNKTLLNNVVINAEQPYLLKNGDRIKFSGKGIFEAKVILSGNDSFREKKIPDTLKPQASPAMQKSRANEPPEQFETEDDPFKPPVPEPKAALIPYRKGMKWGFSDPEQRVMIPLIFDEVLPFSGKFAATRADKKWGFIDTSGEFALAPAFDKVLPFTDGRAGFSRASKWGFINDEGRECIFPKYDEVRQFVKGIAMVRSLGKWGFVNLDGTEILPPSFEEVGNIHRDLIKVKKGIFYGYVSKTGKMAIEPRFMTAGDFTSGFAAVSTGGKFGFINSRGEEKIPQQFDAALPFTDGLAAVKANNLWGYINKSGSFKIACKYKSCGFFSMGLAAVSTASFLWMEEKWGFINRDGLDTIPPNFDHAAFFAKGICPVKIKNKWGFIDKFGNALIDCRYDQFKINLNEPNYFIGQGLIPASRSGRFGFIDILGNEVVAFKYDSVGEFSSGICPVRFTGLQGYVDEKGKEFFQE